jgi:putative membrane protein
MSAPSSGCSVFVNLLAKTTGEPLLAPLMSAMHGLYARWRRIFERDGNNRTANFYRFWNEVPTILLLIIVAMAVAKPF